LALQTVPFETVPGRVRTFAADLPPEIEEAADCFFCLAVLGSPEQVDMFLYRAELAVPGSLRGSHTVELAEFAGGANRTPIAMAAYTGHKCFRLVMDDHARKAFDLRRTLQITLPERVEADAGETAAPQLQVSLWILTRD